jgi:DNA polymerase III delta prime subunit
MELIFPPPHYLFFEALNDVETLKVYNTYKVTHEKTCEFHEIDATEMNSVDTFAPWFDNWICQIPKRQSTRFRILLILHSEFLTYACQQMIRRSLEQRSFRSRVWFHVEDHTVIQPAIQSRCVIKRILPYFHKPIVKII